jgi:hypothetical protein
MFCLSYPEKIKLQALRCLRDWHQMDNVLCDLFCTEDRRVYEKKAQILLDLAFGELLEKQASYLFGNLYKQGAPKPLGEGALGFFESMAGKASRGPKSVSRGAPKGTSTKAETPGRGMGAPPSAAPTDEYKYPGSEWMGAKSGPTGGVETPSVEPTAPKKKAPSTKSKEQEEMWAPPSIKQSPLDEKPLPLSDVASRERTYTLNTIFGAAHRKLQKNPKHLDQAINQTEEFLASLKALKNSPSGTGVSQPPSPVPGTGVSQPPSPVPGTGASGFFSSMLKSPLFWGLGLTELGNLGMGYFLRNSGNQNVSSQNVSSFDSDKVNRALELMRNYNRQQGYHMEPEVEGRLMEYLLYLARRNPGISVEELYNRARSTLRPIEVSQK